jgi:ABC-type nickel/cobalt efflux system permease component RcnA
MVVLLLVALFGVVGSAAAHPLGNFTISRYSGLTVGDEMVDVLYVVDMAEIPTFQERQEMDTDGDGAITAGEEDAYLAIQIPALAENLQLSVNHIPLQLEIQNYTLSFPPGQGDLPTTRLEIRLAAALPATTNSIWDAHYEDGNFAGRLGWQEVVIQTGDGVTLQDTTVPTASISDELRSYPDDLLQAPLRVNQANFRFTPVGVSASESASSPSTEVVAGEALLAEQNRFGQDEFANLLSRTLDTPGAVAAVLFLAFTLGAAHALTPGHGKTIVGAYLVGSRGTARHALFLGLTTTITHTAGVFALGLLVLFASEFILPERLYPWLGVLSGLLVVTIGFSILRGHVSHWRAHRSTAHHLTPHHHTKAQTDEGYHYHFGFGHSHRHDHGHDHAGHNHSHPPGSQTMNWRNLLALGISGGLLPCPSALVLLLSAIALHQVGVGLLLILVFSVGLASVLTGIGLILVYAGRYLERLPLRHTMLTRRVLPAASAAFITVAGLVITFRALVEAGVI